MSTDVTNANRAEWAQEALDRFRSITCCDHEDSLGDLLCDLMHWADANSFDFALALERAEGHYEAEVAEAPRACRQTTALLEALEQALEALNTVPRFPVPSLLTDSYRVAAMCDRAIAKAKGRAS
jgi:hypothetical protein